MHRLHPARSLGYALGICVALCLAAWTAAAPAQTPAQREERIKAALVFKLVKFIDWPASHLSGKDPLQICALGDSPVNDALAAVDGKPVRDRLAQFRKLATLTPAEIKGCHVLYIPGNAKDIAGGLPASLRSRGLLTVSDMPEFARRGGLIGLTHGENKVGFEINLRNARDSGLEPGAPLLELATVIE